MTNRDDGSTEIAKAKEMATEITATHNHLRCSAEMLETLKGGPLKLESLLGHTTQMAEALDEVKLASSYLTSITAFPMSVYAESLEIANSLAAATPWSQLERANDLFSELKLTSLALAGVDAFPMAQHARFQEMANALAAATPWSQLERANDLLSELKLTSSVLAGVDVFPMAQHARFQEMANALAAATPWSQLERANDLFSELKLTSSVLASIETSSITTGYAEPLAVDTERKLLIRLNGSDFDLGARSISIGGDFVGRDRIVTNNSIVINAETVIINIFSSDSM